MEPEYPVIDHRSAWRADKVGKQDMTIELDDRHLYAFDRALQAVHTAGIDLCDITREHFDLADIAGDVLRWRNEIMDGYGLVILKGFPIEQYSQDDIAMTYWGLATQIGIPMSQSMMGDRLGHVVDVAGKDPRERAYRNSTELSMHTDACDVVGMLCLQKAIEGGVSGYASAITVYNEITKRRPDLLPILFHGFYYHRFGEEQPGQAPVTEQRIPVFSLKDGYLSVNYLRAYIDLACQKLNQPLTDEETEALDLVDEIAHGDAIALRFITEPGEAVFFNNLTVLHNRSAFEDADEPEKKRHLLRLWLVAHQQRPTVNALRIFEGKGIAKQAGKGAYFGKDLNYDELGKGSTRASD
jgi:hypothetical protein